jgi:hypothetical protein
MQYPKLGILIWVGPKTPYSTVTKSNTIKEGMNLDFITLNLSTMSNIDSTCINTIRALAADITREANAGHPGNENVCNIFCIKHAIFNHSN